MTVGRSHPSEDAVRFVQRMHAVAGGAALRRHAVARALRALAPPDAARMLTNLLALSRSGDEAALCVLGAVLSALEDPRLAREVGGTLALLPPEALGEEVAGLLASGPAWRSLDEDAGARTDARTFRETLGFLKTRARCARDPDALSRLARASHPAVVRNLLLNPRLTEERVVRLAARRPAAAAPLVEIWRSRWGQRRAVRRALVLNPYLPPEVGVKLLPLLVRSDWEEVAGDGGLHPSVRAEARHLLRSGSPERLAAPEPAAVTLDDDA